MGDIEEWAQPSGLLPNGLLANDAASVTQVLDSERWSKAEERTAELIARIQPNKPSEERRNAVADYVQRLIMKCFSCQVFTFGSVPLKTYLPDGDIDLTAFSKNQHVKDTWATEVRDMLENEEKSENAEFRVKEVQYIQADVKIIKCLVENIVVDISFNQLGGLCTLCFLEEVDHLINQNHLFKRSIILIKAWCYYESRLLGAHHGLISTYALETLVLYIFHVFNNSFTGPLEVLYRFLGFFSNFDWDNCCVSLWGPVPISSLPDMTAEPPRKDNGDLLLSKIFLDACSSVYAVFPGGQENQGQPFISKHFNVIDPLRTNNNLGRSVSKGNFFRIRSAFAFGAKRLARLLECPKENLVLEVNQFFMNTWERHGSGCRPDAPSATLCLMQPINFDDTDASGEIKNYPRSKKKNEKSTTRESMAEGNQAFHGLSSQHGFRSSDTLSRSNNVLPDYRTQSKKNFNNQTSSRVPDQLARSISSIESVQPDKGPKNSRADYLINEIQGRYQFARTRSSPELTDTSNEVSLRARRNRVPDGMSMVASKADYSRRNNSELEVPGTHGTRSSIDDPASMRHNSFRQGIEATTNSTIPLSNCHDEEAPGSVKGGLASVAASREMHLEEQDLVNMMASSRINGLGSQVQMPMNFAPHLPLQTSTSVLASMGYSQKNLVGMLPTNIPLVGPPWGSHMHFPQGLSSPLSHYSPSTELASNTEEIVELSNGNSDLRHANQGADPSFWHDDQDAGSSRGFDSGNGGFPMLQSDDDNQSSSVGFGYVPLSPVGNSGSYFVRGQQRFAKENRGLVREEVKESFHQNNRDEVYLTNRSPSLRLPTSQVSSSRSKASSESSSDASTVKTSKSGKDRRGRRVPPSVTSTMHGKGKNGWQHEVATIDHSSSQGDDDNRDWIPLSMMNDEVEDRTTGPALVVPSHVRSHQMRNYVPAEVSRSESVIPVTSMLVGSSSSQRGMDNSGMVPFAFYLPGSPVPFLTMLPVFNLPTETGNSDGSTNNFDREETMDKSHKNKSDQNLDSAESLDQSEIFSSSCSTKHSASVDPSEEPCDHNTDILHSDFASHWQNLQYGRFCQNPRYHGPPIYPSPVMVPSAYLQGHIPWEGPGRPVSPNGNIVSQLMSYGPHLVSVAPFQPGSNRPTSVYQRYGDELPRYRSGTGTYLPNTKVSLKDRHSSNSRNQRGNYNYDHNDRHSDREGNWNNNTRPRASGRNYNRSQVDRLSPRSDRLASSESRVDRPWESFRHDSFPSHQSQNGPFGSSNITNSVPANVAYGMYPLQAVNSNGVAPSVVMLYPYDHNAGYGSPPEQLEFGTLGPIHFSGTNEVSQLGERGLVRGVYEHQKFQGGSPAYSSPDQPSSPQLQR